MPVCNIRLPASRNVNIQHTVPTTITRHRTTTHDKSLVEDIAVFLCLYSNCTRTPPCPSFTRQSACQTSIKVLRIEASKTTSLISLMTSLVCCFLRRCCGWGRILYKRCVLCWGGQGMEGLRRLRRRLLPCRATKSWRQGRKERGTNASWRKHKR